MCDGNFDAAMELVKLRQEMIQEFPNAMAFRGPGFDTVSRSKR